MYSNTTAHLPKLCVAEFTDSTVEKNEINDAGEVRHVDVKRIKHMHIDACSIEREYVRLP